MRLDAFMLADSAETDEAGKLRISGADISQITTQELPFRVSSLASVARLLWERQDVEEDREVHLQIRLFDPAGEEMGATRPFSPPKEFLPSDLEEGEEGEEHAIFFVVRLDGATIRSTGRYRVELVMNEQPVAERPITVTLSGEPPDEAAASD